MGANFSTLPPFDRDQGQRLKEAIFEVCPGKAPINTFAVGLSLGGDNPATILSHIIGGRRSVGLAWQMELRKKLGDERWHYVLTGVRATNGAVPGCLILPTTVGSTDGILHTSGLGSIASPERLLAQVRALADKTFHRDFENSPLAAFSRIETEADQSLRILKAAKILRSSRTKLLRDPIFVDTSAYYGIPPVEALRRLRRHGTLTVSTSSIAVAVAAVFRCMATHKDFNLNITVLCSDVNGRDQMRTLSRTQHPPDFLVAANPAFFFANEAIHDDYQVLLPCFYADQYLIRRRDWVKKAGATAFVFPESSAHEMARVPKWKQFLTDFNMRQIEACDVPDMAKVMEQPDLLIVWEPMASAILSRNPNLEMFPQSSHPVSFCLDVNHVWLEKEWRPVMQAFEACFIAAWNLCEKSRAYSWSLLCNDEAFLRSFAAGAGIAMPFHPVLSVPNVVVQKGNDSSDESTRILV